MIRFIDFLHGVPTPTTATPSSSLVEAVRVAPSPEAVTPATPVIKAGRTPQTMSDAFASEKKALKVASPAQAATPPGPRRKGTTFKDVFAEAGIRT